LVQNDVDKDQMEQWQF